MPGFLYCLNSSTIRPAPILKKIEVAAQAGYSAIELWHDDIDAHVARLRKKLQKAGAGPAITTRRGIGFVLTTEYLTDPGKET